MVSGLLTFFHSCGINLYSNIVTTGIIKRSEGKKKGRKKLIKRVIRIGRPLPVNRLNIKNPARMKVNRDNDIKMTFNSPIMVSETLVFFHLYLKSNKPIIGKNKKSIGIKNKRIKKIIN